MSIIVQFEFSKEEGPKSCEGFTQLNLLAHAQLIERELNSKCGGHCECGTCRVEILSGNVSAMKEEERALLKKMGFDENSRVRLACQTFPEDCSSNGVNTVCLRPKK